MISIETLREKLTGYPDTCIQDYSDFTVSHSTESLNRFVVGIIIFIIDSSEDLHPNNINDDTRLQEDLGADSITIAELVFLFEDIFEIEIDNADLMAISTMGDLKSFIVKKLN